MTGCNGFQLPSLSGLCPVNALITVMLSSPRTTARARLVGTDNFTTAHTPPSDISDLDPFLISLVPFTTTPQALVFLGRPRACSAFTASASARDHSSHVDRRNRTQFGVVVLAGERVCKTRTRAITAPSFGEISGISRLGLPPQFTQTSTTTFVTRLNRGPTSTQTNCSEPMILRRHSPVILAPARRPTSRTLSTTLTQCLVPPCVSSPSTMPGLVFAFSS
jgi:hypothetical protein